MSLTNLNPELHFYVRSRYWIKTVNLYSMVSYYLGKICLTPVFQESGIFLVIVQYSTKVKNSESLNSKKHRNGPSDVPVLPNFPPHYSLFLLCM